MSIYLGWYIYPMADGKNKYKLQKLSGCMQVNIHKNVPINRTCTDRPPLLFRTEYYEGSRVKFYLSLNQQSSNPIRRNHKYTDQLIISCVCLIFLSVPRDHCRSCVFHPYLNLPSGLLQTPLGFSELLYSPYMSTYTALTFLVSLRYTTFRVSIYVVSEATAANLPLLVSATPPLSPSLALSDRH